MRPNTKDKKKNQTKKQQKKKKLRGESNDLPINVDPKKCRINLISITLLLLFNLYELYYYSNNSYLKK